MTDDQRIPTWVLSHLNDSLPANTYVINARSIHKGGWKGAYLVNTNQGAVLVQKTRIGEPKVTHLPLPGRHYGLTCQKCMHRTQFTDLEPPEEVFCPNCGQEYLLTTWGTAEPLDDPLPRPGTVLQTPVAAPPMAVFKETPPEPVPEAPPEPEAPTTPEPIPEGPFTYKGYTLYGRDVELKGGGSQTIYFFSKHPPKSGRPVPKPDDRYVGENARTGLPFLTKDRNKARVVDGARHKKPVERVQCGAFRADGKQCQRTARAGSKYCSTHKGYHPKGMKAIQASQDTKPRVAKAEDTLPGKAASKKDAKLQAQCAAITADGRQCRNSSRRNSKYCASHRNYRARGNTLAGLDTKPARRGVKDTKPSVRKTRAA